MVVGIRPAILIIVSGHILDLFALGYSYPYCSEYFPYQLDDLDFSLFRKNLQTLPRPIDEWLT